MSPRDREHVLRLLEGVGGRDLERALDDRNGRQLERLAGLSREGRRSARELAPCVLAFHNEALFTVKAVRRGLLASLPSLDLRGLADLYLERPYEKPYDNALALALLPWKAGSEWVERFAEAFDIPFQFLPAQETSTPSLETIEAQPVLGQLFDYQRDTVADVCRRLTKGKRLLLQMPTGAGKTRVAVEVLLRRISESGGFGSGVTLVWLAHSEELCEQAIESFRSVWMQKGDGGLRVVRLFGSRRAPPAALRGALVVATFQKLHSLIKDRQNPVASVLRDSIGFLVADEAHKTTARTFRAGIEYLLSPSACLLGLTATPGRSLVEPAENRDLVLLFRDGLVRPPLGENMVAELREQGILAHLKRKVIQTNALVELSRDETERVESGGDFSVSVLARLAENEPRNLLLLDAIEEQARMGRPCIVFGCTVAHAGLLSAALNLRGVSSRHVDSRMSKERRSEAVRSYRDGEVDVLANYGILSTGFDAPRTRVVVITRPTSSVVLYGQMIGRALRGPRVGGASESLLIDVRDNLDRFGRVEHVLSVFGRYWTA